jgi:hypothetical protein
MADVKHTKRKGPQECEACYRWIDTTDTWICPFCRHDNTPGQTIQQVRRERATEAKRKKR